MGQLHTQINNYCRDNNFLLIHGMRPNEGKENDKGINLNIEMSKPKINDISSIVQDGPINNVSSIIESSSIPIKSSSIPIKSSSIPIKGLDEINEPDETYDVSFCCCKGRTSSCDKGLLEFFAKTTVSFSVLSFCFISLLNKTGDAAFLSSTISLILGTYLGSQISPPPNSNRS